MDFFDGYTFSSDCSKANIAYTGPLWAGMAFRKVLPCQTYISPDCAPV